ncbi:kinase-like domain-containing protein [Abortiporus biennis]|nr:kinase-like domain-containing protein [Abortiporus biennis]
MADIPRDAPKRQPKLLSFEVFWRDHQLWLEEQGYMLRPRYKPDWKPAWNMEDSAYMKCEDHLPAGHRFVLDATRISDGRTVALKHIVADYHNPQEIPINEYFSSAPLASDPRNHCVPLYDVLKVPDTEWDYILVYPYLCPADYPMFSTIGEAVEFFRQLIEGVQFMHHHDVAHRDIMMLNTMMDPAPVFAEPIHLVVPTFTLDIRRRSKFFTRTVKPTRYYLIDFGLSRRYSENNLHPLEPPIPGGDRTVPEFQPPNLYKLRNPFCTDIYYLGNMFRTNFLQTMHGFSFMNKLVEDMVQNDPNKRPTIDEVADKFDKIRQSLSGWKLRSRSSPINESIFRQVSESIRHLYTTSVYIHNHLDAIPRPPDDLGL